MTTSTLDDVRRDETVRPFCSFGLAWVDAGGLNFGIPTEIDVFGGVPAAPAAIALERK